MVTLQQHLLSDVEIVPMRQQSAIGIERGIPFFMANLFQYFQFLTDTSHTIHFATNIQHDAAIDPMPTHKPALG